MVKLEISAVFSARREQMTSHFTVAAFLTLILLSRILKDQVVLGGVRHELGLVSAEQGSRYELEYAHLLDQLDQV